MYLSDIPACLNRNKQPYMPILSCSKQGLPHYSITTTMRALLPHVFTLTFDLKAVLFCGTFRELTLPLIVIVANVFKAPCLLGVRTFLFVLQELKAIASFYCG